MRITFEKVVDFHMTDPGYLQSLADKNIPRSDLNECQLKAVKMALNDERPLVCIQGAPGTGKTYTLACLIFRMLKMKKKVLVVGATRGPLMVLKEMVEKIVEKKTKELRDWNSSNLMDFTNNAHLDGLSQEEQENMRLVFVTLDSTFLEDLAGMVDPCVCIIDEAAHVPKIQPFPELLKSTKMVMAGDPWSFQAEISVDRRRRPAESILSHVLSNQAHFSHVLLDEQFRSLKEITAWPNKCFYKYPQQNACSQDELVKILDPQPDEFFQRLYAPLVHIDTTLVTDLPDRWETYEQLSKSTEWDIPDTKNSFVNPAEAKYALLHYKNLIERSVKPESIAILSPYGAQVALLKGMICSLSKENEKFEDCKNTVIGTADDVQGREFDTVILSTVRSNPQKNLGWIALDLNRLNVLSTRARKHFMIIGNGFMMENCIEPKICQLFEITRKSCRLDPEMLHGRWGSPVPCNMVGNFGLYYDDFITHTNNPLMHDWCRESAKVLREKDGQPAMPGMSASLPFHQVIDLHASNPAFLEALEDKKTIPNPFISGTKIVAIKMALNEERPLVCIQGAPGTGKTYTLGCLIFEILKRNKKVLVVGATKVSLMVLKKMVEMLVTIRKKEFPEWNSSTLLDFTDDTNLDRFCQTKQNNLSVAFVTLDAPFFEELTSKFDACMCIIDDAAQVAKNQRFPRRLSSMRIVMAGHPYSHHIDERLGRPAESILDHVLRRKEHFSHVIFTEQFSNPEMREDLLQKSEQVKNLTAELEKTRKELKAFKIATMEREIILAEERVRMLKNERAKLEKE